MERLLIPAGTLTQHASLIKDRKRVRKSDLQLTQKAKKRRQGEDLVRTLLEETLCAAERVTYEAGTFYNDSLELFKPKQGYSYLFM